MANAYKVKHVEMFGSGYFTALRGTASTTLVKGIYFSHDDHNTIVTLALTKSGTSTPIPLCEVSHTADNMTQLLPDTIALESGDQLEVKSTHITSSDVGHLTVNYVENTTSLSGQSIGVLTDVNIATAPTNGQVLVWNNTAGEFQPGDQSSGSGTVTSVGITAGTGISSSGGPITTSGNISVALDASIDDLTDVATTGKIPNDVLAWDGSNWVYSRRVSLLYELLKEGSSKTITAESTNADETEGFVKLEATTAKLKVNNTGVEISETSPGDIEFVVATDSSGSTAFTALHIDGSTTANVSDIIVKAGAYFKFDDGLYTQWIKPTSGNTGNTAIVLPSSSGQLALTTDLYTDSDADARIAAASVTDLTDVSSAGSGAIITTAERTKLTGIAAGAEVNVNADWNATSGDALILNKPTIPTNTNISNTNLALDGNRTLDQDGSNLTIDPSSGIFQVNDSSGFPTVPEIQVGQGQLDLMGLRFPNADGSANQVIKTNGSGVLSFVDQTSLANTDIAIDDNRTIDGNGNDLTIDPNSGVFSINDSAGPPTLAEFEVAQGYVDLRGNAVRIHGLSYPSSDGTNGQVLTTNGSGTLSFTTPSGGGGGGLGSADQTLTADRTIDTNGFNLDIELDPTGTADTFTIHDGTHDLFQVDTTTSGTLFSVNDVSGLPVFQSNDDGSAVLPKILTAAPTGTATEGTMQLGIVSGTCYLYVYINGGWKSTTLT